MRETTFYIVLNLKTCAGFESYGRFFIGNKREIAEALFANLKGNKEVDESTILTLDMVETINNLPVNMDVLGCSLDQMAENCKLITKETFRMLNLEEI
jgi:hypothetical protein